MGLLWPAVILGVVWLSRDNIELNTDSAATSSQAPRCPPPPETSHAGEQRKEPAMKRLALGAAVAGGAALMLHRLAPKVREMHSHCREMMRPCGGGTSAREPLLCAQRPIVASNLDRCGCCERLAWWFSASGPAS